MEFAIKTDGRGCDSEIHIHLDSEDGKEIGTCLIGKEDGVYTTVVERPTGRHAIYFTVQTSYPKDGWMATFFEGRELFAMHSFTFMLLRTILPSALSTLPPIHSILFRLF